ncbi:MAG: hypothetical protein SVU32_05445 [Candidatus Nanohaloarchaea archaeon]|nr:hypothetical protein [Candidatus Nanohaloarchaea archaeon]
MADEEVVDEIEAGKNNWNTFEVGLNDDAIFIRDDSGYIDFSEDEIDDLVNAMDQARRRLRELKRRPTQE